MKLYEEYKQFLNNELSKGFKLMRAWFTSFNLSPEFFESYILPPLLGQTDEIPRSFIQFEELIAEYAKQEGNSLDICVFHDASMPIEGIKKTTIPFHGVLHEKGLFHPKVALFVFQNEQETKAFVMVGSANLTLSGWARNRECVAIRQIETTSQGEQVKSFFNSFCKPKELNSSDLGVLRTESLVNDWSLIFTHPLPQPNTTFINKLLELKQTEWRVWSPYFSDINCIENVRASFKENGSEIQIIPDLLGKKIRMDKTTTSDGGQLKFYSDNQKDFDGQMTHAKVWLSPHYLVLGSHNFTEPAMQHQNIEASIVIPQANDALFSSVTLEEVKVELMNNDELKENNLPEKTGSFLVSVEANHKKHSITLSTEGLPPHVDYTIILPGSVSLEIPKFHGNKKKISLDFSQLQKSRFWKALVTDKQVLLECVNQGDSDKKRGFGYIIETGLEARQAFQYDSLESLMLDVLSGYPADSSKRLVHLANIRDERELGINETQNNDLDYFHLFDFFYKIEQKFNKLDDDNALFYSPNSLFSLKGLIEEEVNKSADASKKVYLALLVHEFNALVDSICKRFNKQGLNSLKICSKTIMKFSKEQLEFIKSINDIKVQSHE